MTVPQDPVQLDRLSIWQQHYYIQKERNDYMRDIMSWYDNNVYYPSLKKLREKCEEVGHVKGNFHNNGLGGSWYYCLNCGAEMEIENE